MITLRQPNVKTIQIKRSFTVEVPERLEPGELAWSEPTLTLYIGLEDGTPLAIAGKNSQF